MIEVFDTSPPQRLTDTSDVPEFCTVRYEDLYYGMGRGVVLVLNRPNGPPLRVAARALKKPGVDQKLERFVKNAFRRKIKRYRRIWAELGG